MIFSPIFFWKTRKSWIFESFKKIIGPFNILIFLTFRNVIFNVFTFWKLSKMLYNLAWDLEKNVFFFKKIAAEIRRGGCDEDRPKRSTPLRTYHLIPAGRGKNPGAAGPPLKRWRLSVSVKRFGKIFEKSQRTDGVCYSDRHTKQCMMKIM